MKRFSKKEIFYDSESDGYFRILLIPVFCYLYITVRNGTRIFVCSAGCSALQPDRSV